jgi:hypothetical protein
MLFAATVVNGLSGDRWLLTGMTQYGITQTAYLTDLATGNNLISHTGEKLGSGTLQYFNINEGQIGVREGRKVLYYRLCSVIDRDRAWNEVEKFPTLGKPEINPTAGNPGNFGARLTGESGFVAWPVKGQPNGMAAKDPNRGSSSLEGMMGQPRDRAFDHEAKAYLESSVRGPNQNGQRAIVESDEWIQTAQSQLYELRSRYADEMVPEQQYEIWKAMRVLIRYLEP